LSKTLIVGDIHLGKGLNIGKNYLNNSYNSRVLDQIKLLDWIVDQVLEHDVSQVILTGDIFEEARPEYYLLLIFIDFLNKLELYCINCHIISGNHDIKRSGSVVNSVLDIIDTYDFDHIFYHKNLTTIHTEGASFTLLPYKDRRGMNAETINDALKSIEECISYEILGIPYEDKKVLIGHLALEGALYVGDEVDDYINEIICPLSLFMNYDYTWMGHVHKPQILNRNPHISHIGSLDLSDYGETGHTKILILFDPNSADHFKEIPVPSRPLRRLKINIPEDQNSTDYVIELLKEHDQTLSYKNALVKLEITINGENKTIDKKIVEEFIYSLGAFYISNISESRNISVVSQEKRDLVDNTIEPKSAIKLYAESTTFKNDDEKNDFLKECFDIVDELKENVK
jgi:exonuclease SbcD